MFVADFLGQQGDLGDWIASIGVLGAMLGGGYAIVVVCAYLDRRTKRGKPDNYVGVFRRPDGAVVHVYRLGGELQVASDEPVGVFPRHLGTVDGRTLLHWTKLASDPNEAPPRGIPSP